MPAETLFLFTKTFPFGKGEQYLEEELPLLSEAFSRIIIVPCSVFDANPQTSRTLPQNVEIFIVNKKLPPKTLGDRISDSFFVRRLVREAKAQNSDGEFLEHNIKQYKAILVQQLACARAVEQFILREKIAVSRSVFYSYWVHNSCIILGILKEKNVIPQYVTRAHSYDLYHRAFYPEQPEKSPLAWERFKFRTADRVYCISEHGANFLKAKYPDWAAKFRVSRLGVETPAALNPPAQNGETFRIVTCSTIQPLKRVDSVAEIISKLDFPVEWIHFGTGEAAAEEELKQKFEQVKKPGDVFLFRGYTPNKEVKNFYASTHVDLVLNLSLAEGVPVALMEAISYGIPVLATDVYGNPEVAKDSAGFVVPKNFAAEGVAQIIAHFRNNPEQQTNMRNAARQLQEKDFDAGKNFRTFIEALKH